MKRIDVALLAGAMVLLSGAAMASSAALSASKPKVMAVLVEVDAQGHITKALPSIQLSPQFQRLLVKNLGEWITHPAVIKGHAVASQMIVDVALRATPHKGGDYDVSFAYVSRLPSPFGGAAAHWVWSHNDNQLALVSDSGATQMQQRDFRMPEPYSPPAIARDAAAPAPSQATERVASNTTAATQSTSSASVRNH